MKGLEVQQKGHSTNFWLLCPPLRPILLLFLVRRQCHLVVRVQADQDGLNPSFPPTHRLYLMPRSFFRLHRTLLQARPNVQLCFLSRAPVSKQTQGRSRVKRVQCGASPSEFLPVLNRLVAHFHCSWAMTSYEKHKSVTWKAR